MSLTGLKKHVRVLEEAGLVSTEKRGRSRHCQLGPRRLEDVAEWLENYRHGWDQRFDRVEELIDQNEVHRNDKRSEHSAPDHHHHPQRYEVRIERVFDAPRELVWEAYTDPELLCEWLGPHRLTMTVQEMDVRSGGSYRYTHESEEDGAFVFFGEFREVDPPRLLVQTFNFEGNEGGESVDRVEFEEISPERSRLVVTGTSNRSRPATKCCAHGMEKGVNEGYEALDGLLYGACTSPEKLTANSQLKASSPSVDAREAKASDFGPISTKRGKKMRWITKKRAFVALGCTCALAVAGAAIAYFTSNGSGTGIGHRRLKLGGDAARDDHREPLPRLLLAGDVHGRQPVLGRTAGRHGQPREHLGRRGPFRLQHQDQRRKPRLHDGGGSRQPGLPDRQRPERLRHREPWR